MAAKNWNQDKRGKQPAGQVATRKRDKAATRKMLNRVRAVKKKLKNG